MRARFGDCERLEVVEKECNTVHFGACLEPASMACEQ